MILPFTMAKRFALPSVIEVTRKTDGEISAPECSALLLGSATRAVGFHPIGQNGFRLLLSMRKVDLFLNSRPAPGAAAVPAAVLVAVAVVAAAAAGAGAAGDVALTAKLSWPAPNRA